MQAIITKYCGPTNSKGARYKATAEAGSVILSQDCAESSAQNHARAAKALATKFGWAGTYTGGQAPDGTFAWVAPDTSDTFTA